MSWIIYKSSRSPESGPYAGPSCKTAHTRPGCVYKNLQSAKRAIRRLNAANPIGFKITTA